MKFKLIWALVNDHETELMVKTAREAGATGSTVITEARGEVVVILHEGTQDERRFRLPYRLFKPKQTVTVARIDARS